MKRTERQQTGFVSLSFLIFDPPFTAEFGPLVGDLPIGEWFKGGLLQVTRKKVMNNLLCDIHYFRVSLPALGILQGVAEIGSGRSSCGRGLYGGEVVI